MSGGYETEVGSIRSDAKIWDDAADDLKEPRRAVRSLGIDPLEIGTVGVAVGLHETYEQVRQRVDDLLGEARTSSAKLAKTLRSVANQYENQESAGAADMAGLSQAVEGS